MTTDIALLASPIDALSLLHQALRTEAERVEQTGQQLEIGSSLKAFQPSSYRWALALSAYVEAEERALTTLVSEGARLWAHVTDVARQVLERLAALMESEHASVSSASRNRSSPRQTHSAFRRRHDLAGRAGAH